MKCFNTSCPFLEDENTCFNEWYQSCDDFIQGDGVSDSSPAHCSPRPWSHLIGGDSPWNELEAFETWLKSKLHAEHADYLDNAPAGFTSYLYAAFATELEANDKMRRGETNVNEVKG